MRLATHIWVSAFVRSENSAGLYAAVLRKGAAEAGAVFVIQRHPDGENTLYGPAPQSAFGQDGELDRKFERVAGIADEAGATRYLDKQIAFDSDCWVLETGGREPPRFLKLVG